jgi:hypothetical protein
MRDRAIWKTPPALWRDGLAGAIPLDRPAVLRFDSDDFIERLQANLDDTNARDVGSFVLRPETWKAPAVGLGAAPTAQVPRLYQPMHGRFYLVTGGLVCERYGLPDKAIHSNCGESVFYLLRRLEPVGNAPVDPADRATYREYGWVPSGPAGTWVAVGDEVAAGEERLPLFPMIYTDQHRRRMLAGTVPVAARERYEGALPPTPIGGTGDPVAVLAKPGRAELERVVLGLQALLQLADETSLVEPAEPSTIALFREATFFALVDLADFLAAHLSTVWDGVASTGFAGTLVSILNNTEFRPDSGAPSWLTALHQAHANRNAVLADLTAPPAPVTGISVDNVRGIRGNPPTVYGRGVLGLQVVKPNPYGDPDSEVVGTVDDPFFILLERALTQLEAAAAPPQQASPPAPQPPPSRIAGAVYAARFVYERPRCPGRQRLNISRPTEAFQLAHAYDPDAPFREHRVVLPIDTSLEGLRKFPQAVKMEISAQLRKQMDRIQAIKLADLDDGNIPEEKPLDLGMICSFSIPIITICALVLLMIIVSLLNIVFFWMPLFKICLPRAS